MVYDALINVELVLSGIALGLFAIALMVAPWLVELFVGALALIVALPLTCLAILTAALAAATGSTVHDAGLALVTVAGLAGVAYAVRRRPAVIAPALASAPASDVIQDAQDALVALGYKVREARAAVFSAMATTGPDATAGAIVKAALQTQQATKTR